jgi:hypothetical protein
MAIEKLTTSLNNKTWTNPQNKNHKNSHEFGLIRPQSQHKIPEYMYSKFSPPIVPSVEKIVYLHGFK